MKRRPKPSPGPWKRRTGIENKPRRCCRSATKLCSIKSASTESRKAAARTDYPQAHRTSCQYPVASLAGCGCPDLLITTHCFAITGVCPRARKKILTGNWILATGNWQLRSEERRVGKESYGGR